MAAGNQRTPPQSRERGNRWFWKRLWWRKGEKTYGFSLQFGADCFLPAAKWFFPSPLTFFFIDLLVFHRASLVSWLRHQYRIQETMRSTLASGKKSVKWWWTSHTLLALGKRQWQTFSEKLYKEDCRDCPGSCQELTMIWRYTHTATKFPTLQSWKPVMYYIPSRNGIE